MMDAEERDIFYFLRSEPERFIPRHVIARHAGGKRRFGCVPDWAIPVLARMMDRGIVEADATGAYRLRPVPQETLNSPRWVSPQIAAILRKSGKHFHTGTNGKDDEDYYNSL